MFDTPAVIISTLALALVGVAWLASLRAFSADGTPALKLFSLACFSTVIAEALGTYLKSKGQPLATEQTNHWVYSIHHYVYFMIVSRAYYNLLSSDLMAAFIQLFRIGFTVFFIFNCFFGQGISTYQTLTVVIAGSLVMVLALAYFWELLISPLNEKITRDPFFWISFGLVFSLGGTIPFHGMFNYLSEKFYDFTVFYQLYVFNGFTTILNILIVIGFLCRKNFQK